MEDLSRIERIFHAAMEKPNRRRRAYLRDICVNDAEFERSLEFVKTAEAADDFMSTSIGLPPFSPSLTNGDVLGNWRINKIIGSGGMGEVYLVQRKTDDFKHVAALKLARTKDAKYLARFAQERETLAKLEHANIGRLIDGGVHQENQPYFVMEWVDGQTITEFAQSRNLKQPAKLKLFIQLCRAVSHAHTRLVLHRDIKPANVLVSEDGQVKLIDFGVSYDLSLDNQTEDAPTTMAYAAPEQLAGKPVTTATDIYALGSLLHKLLTGLRLDSGEDISSKLPADLGHIIQKCRMTDPLERYISVDALAADIARFSKSEPVNARAGGWSYRAAKFIARYKLATAVSALFIISLVAGLGGTYTMLKRAQVAQIEEEFDARVAEGYRLGLQALYGEDNVSEGKLDPKIIDKTLLRIGLEAQSNFDPANLDDGYILLSMGKHFTNRSDWSNAEILLTPLEDVLLTTPIMAYLSIEGRSELALALNEINKKQPLKDASMRRRIEKITRQLLLDRQRFKFTSVQTHIRDARMLSIATVEEKEADAFGKLVEKNIADELKKTGLDDGNLIVLYTELAAHLYRRGKVMESLEPFEKAFEIQRKQGIRTLTDAAAATNMAQYQIYLKEDGITPETYLPDYIPIMSSEYGNPTSYAWLQGIRAKAALLTHRWGLAEETARLAMNKIEDEKDFKGGWYYELVDVRVRALTRLGHYDQARGLYDQGLIDLGKENIVYKWEFKECRLYLADAYLTAFETGKDQAAPMFDKAEALCKSMATKDWDKETIMPKLIARLRKEALIDR